MSYEYVKLGSVIKLEYGKGLNDSERSEDGLYCAYGANGVKSHTNKFLYDQPSIIIGRKGSAGELTLVNKKFWALDVSYYLTHNPKKTDLRFLYWALITKNLPTLAKGIKPGLNRNDVYDLEIPLPPLETQQKIVSKLDSLFAEIDKSISATAINIKNAELLFQSYLDGEFCKKSTEWSVSTLEEIVEADCSLSYGIVQPGDDFDGGLPIVRPTDLSSKYITRYGLKRINPILAEGYKRTTLTGAELLLCVRGSTGTVSVSSEDLSGCNVTRGIVPIRFRKDKIHLNYGYFFLNSSNAKKQIALKTYGAALKQINIADVKKLKIVYPTLSEQENITEKLEEIQSNIKLLKTGYIKKLDAINVLKQSALRQAFAGELVKD